MAFSVANFMTDERAHRRQMAFVLQNILRGNIGLTKDITAQDGATQTTVNFELIGPRSMICLMPLSANAAAIQNQCWWSSISRGTAVLNHPNSANTDQNFRILVME